MTVGTPEMSATAASELALVRRLCEASDVLQATSVLLDFLLEGRGLSHALVLVESGEAFQGIGSGLAGAAAVGEIRIPRDELRPDVLAILEEGEPGILAASDTGLDLTFDPVGIIPLALGGDGRSALVLVARESLDGGAENLVEILAGCAPALARVAEVEELREIRKHLRHRTDLITRLVNALPDPVLMTDQQDHTLFSNDRADLLLSSTQDDSERRRRAVEVNNLLLSSFVTKGVVSGERGEESWEELNLVDPRDGSDLYFEVLSVEAGEPGPGARRAVISILRDITDLKRAVSELEAQFKHSQSAEFRARRESERLNVIIENAGEPILVTDSHSNIILLNREAERLFEAGADAGEARRSRAVQANDTKFTTLMSDFLLHDEDRRTGMLNLVDPESGMDLPVRVVSTKILSDRGEVNAVVSVVQDLTQAVENERLARELRQLNEELEERVEQATSALAERNRQLEWQQEELRRASRLKSEFLASMSHELRTPINAVLGYTSLLQERIYGELDDAQDAALGKIHAASNHLLSLITDILDLSKIEAGHAKMNWEEVAPEELVSDLSKHIEPQVRQKSLSFRIELDEEVPAFRTDRTKLSQILLNLLSNAVKFTQEGSVTFRCRSPGPGAVAFDVEDTGIGIEPAQLEDIFEDFRQVDQSRTREYGGTGLGLSISRKLCRLLGGSIAVASTVGEGSTFTVELPLQPSESDRVAADIPELTPPPEA